MSIASVCTKCGEWFHVGAPHECCAERVDGLAKAREAGIEHFDKHPVTIMIVEGNIQAVAFGKVLFETPVLRTHGHDIFAAFLKAWAEAGIDETAC